jgi:drug/metabolite transporter (DMT)-like permease
MPRNAISNPDRRVILFILCLAVLIAQVDTSVVNLAVHAIGVGLRAPLPALQWVVDAYNLSYAALLIPASLTFDHPWTLHPSMSSLGALLARSVFSTAAAFVIYFRLVQTLGSVGTTAQAYLRVPIGVALSMMFLGESLAPTAWIGLICVVAGVAAMTMPHRTKNTA